jgi:ABC-type phosphate transport system substrate-binding protein
LEVIEEKKEMKRKTVVLAVLVVALGISGLVAFSQTNRASRPSPPEKATFTLAAGKTISIDYSSPRAKGRKIFGGLVPFGEVWRAGANEATTFVTTADLVAGGKAVPTGSYTIFAIPDKDKWTLIISKKTGEWGTNYAGPSEDLARADMKVSALPTAVENFTIALDKSAGGCTLRMDWETTRASIEISAK